MKIPRLLTLALICGSVMSSRAQEGQPFLLPALQELSAPALPPGAEDWSKLLFKNQWRDVSGFAALIRDWPDLNRPCKAQAVSPMGVVKHTLQFQRTKTGGFMISAGPEKERVFQFQPFSHEDTWDEEGSCRAHLYYFCVGVYQKPDRSHVRLMLPLKNQEALICVPDVEIKGRKATPLPNRADLIQPLHGIVLPETNSVTEEGKVGDVLSVSALRSLSLRCRVIPHAAFQFTASGSTIATHPWHTVELAAWNGERPSTWSGTTEAEIPVECSFELHADDAVMSIHAHFVNQWANQWSSRWRRALATLPKPKLARVPAGIDEKGSELIREDAAIILKIEAKAIIPFVISNPVAVASARAEETAPGTLGNLQWTVNTAQFTAPPKGPGYYEWSIDPAVFCARAVHLLATAPADVRRAVLYKLGLEEAGGKLKSLKPPPVFTTFAASDIKVEPWKNHGFLIHSGHRNRAAQTDAANGRCTAFAATDVFLKYNLVTTWTGEKGANHKVTMGLQGFTRDYPVMVPLHRDPQ